MSLRTLLFDTTKPTDPVAQELAKLFSSGSLQEALDDSQPGWNSEVAALVLDGSTRNETQTGAGFEAAMAANRPVVLLNVTDPQFMTNLCGVGFKTSCAVVRSYQDGSKVISVLDFAVRSTDSKVAARAGSQDLNGNLRLISEEGAEGPAELEDLHSDHPFTQLAPDEQARWIEELISTDPSFPEIDRYQQKLAADPPGALPPGQVNTVYVQINHTDKIENKQRFTNEVTMVVTLIASYDDPPYKYLQVTSLGAGFSPASGGSLYKNGTYDRRYFQNLIKLKMKANNQVTTLQSSPKNVNGSKSVTTSSSFTAGVDISENPGFNASYTIGESRTESISDFKIINKSSGDTGLWHYQMGITAGSFWNLFDEPFLKKAQVKGLPTLAKENLQPVTTIVWYAPNTFNGSVPIEMNWAVNYYRAWVTGNWTSYTMHSQYWTYSYGYWVDNPFHVDFSRVNPNG